MVFGPDTELAADPAPTTLDAVRPLDLRPAVRYTREGKLNSGMVRRMRPASRHYPAERRSGLAGKRY